MTSKGKHAYLVTDENLERLNVMVHLQCVTGKQMTVSDLVNQAISDYFVRCIQKSFQGDVPPLMRDVVDRLMPKLDETSKNE